MKTLIHELAHALLHSDEFSRSKEVAEVEVESVAYIICDALGLDTGDYSAPDPIPRGGHLGTGLVPHLRNEPNEGSIR